MSHGPRQLKKNAAISIQIVLVSTFISGALAYRTKQMAMGFCSYFAPDISHGDSWHIRGTINMAMRGIVGRGSYFLFHSGEWRYTYSYC